jgi:hypothetical protein
MTPRLLTGLKLLAVLGLAGASLLHLGDAPLHETDEGFAPNRASTLGRQGTWFVTWDGVDEVQPQFRKPPLLYWEVALAYRLFGLNEFAARLPTALAAIGLCLVLIQLFRRLLPEGVAWAGVLLFAAVPFARFHMRTAMLEMPFLFHAFLAILLLAQHPGRTPAVLAGISCGAACLIKGSAGLPALALAVVASALLRSDRRRWAADALWAGLGTIAVLACYFSMVPEPWRVRAWEAFFHDEGMKRQVTKDIGARLLAGGASLWDNLGPLLLAAGGGLAATLVTRRHGRALALGAVLALPCFVGAALQMVAYPRYFLVVYPVVALLAAGAGYALAGGGRALWLALPLALGLAAAAAPLGGALAGLTLLLCGAGFVPAWRACAGLRPLAALLYALGLGASLPAWPTATADIVRELRFDRPAIIPVARRVPDLVPPGETLLFATGRRIKCHQLLFYGQRDLESTTRWARHGWVPGAEKYVLLYGPAPLGLPFAEEQVVARSGDFRLVRARVDPQPQPHVGLFLLHEGTRRESELTIRLLSLEADVAAAGALIRAPPPTPHSVVQTRHFREPLRPGAAITSLLSRATLLTGLDLTTYEPLAAFRGLQVETRDAAGHWSEWVRTDAEPYTELDIEHGRLVKRREPALRVRAAGRVAHAVRIIRLDRTAIRPRALRLYGEALPPP